MAPITNRLKVWSHFYGLAIESNNFAFEVKAEFRLESTIPDGRRRRRRRRPGLSQTKTNSAQAEAGARAEPGNLNSNDDIPNWKINNKSINLDTFAPCVL